MPVNQYKRALASGTPFNGPRRSIRAPAFPELNRDENGAYSAPPPLPGSRKLKASYQKVRAKAPSELLKGVAHRAHSHPKDLQRNFAGMHLLKEGHSKLVPLTRAYKSNK